MTSAAQVERVSAVINSITADGGTSIYPALSSGVEALRREPATRKHVILLTDGWSLPGHFPQLARVADAEHITISTLGIGGDVNARLLQSLARDTRGRSYFVDNPVSIPQIMTGDVRALTTSAIQERRVHAVSVRSAEATDGIDFAHAPPLLGFVRAKARLGSETILRLRGGEPLLVRWQYGLGRVVAFLSDARNRWSADWLRWPSYGTFWPQMVRDVCEPERVLRAGIRPGTGDTTIIFYEPLSASAKRGTASLRNLVPNRLLVSGPDSRPLWVALQQTAPSHFEAAIATAHEGLYSVTAPAEPAFPSLAFYRQSDELTQRQPDLPLLSEISRLTGARVQPTIEELLDSKGAYARERRPLWAYWLLLAFVLNFLELALRKDIFASLSSRLRSDMRPHAQSAATTQARGQDQG